MRTCPNCQSTDIDTDAARGDAVCIQCGTVLEENTIVNEVTFAQDATGGSAVVGQFVAATPGVASSGLGFGKESREVAFTNGQRHISQLAQALRLAEHHQEAAQRLFMLAVQHNFIQGRRTQHVIAACLYTVCRREKTPHLLIDYSDVLQTNVYMLGSCFLKFTRLLSLALPIIDPSLYIHRFASKLEFGDRTHLVSMSALRLVQRMKRDWIQTGRRPSGICGAALLIAARVHGFRRTQREVVRVVRICDVTLRKRLNEFADTPVGALTARELETTDIEALPAANPPSFTRNRMLEAQQLAQLTMTDEEKEREKHVQSIRQLKVADLRERLEELGEDVSGKKDELVERLLLKEKEPEALAGAAPLSLTVSPALLPTQATTDAEAMPPPPPRPVDPAVAAEENELNNEMQQVLRDPEFVALEREAEGAPAGGAAPDAAARAAAAAAAAAKLPVPEGSRDPYWTDSAWFKTDTLASRDEQDDSEEAQEALMAELNDDLEDLDDEVDAYLITDQEEVELKKRVWERMNKDYLDAQADKEAARNEAMAQGQAVGPSAPRPSQSKRQRREAAEARAPGTVAEAVAGELRRNKLSSRINYEVVHILSQTLDEDADSMPNAPGPVGGLASPASSTHSQSRRSLAAGSSVAAAENLSVAGSEPEVDD